jgi:hypothetical protein
MDDILAQTRLRRLRVFGRWEVCKSCGDFHFRNPDTQKEVCGACEREAERAAVAGTLQRRTPTPRDIILRVLALTLQQPEARHMGSKIVGRLYYLSGGIFAEVFDSGAVCLRRERTQEFYDQEDRLNSTTNTHEHLRDELSINYGVIANLAEFVRRAGQLREMIYG